MTRAGHDPGPHPDAGKTGKSPDPGGGVASVRERRWGRLAWTLGPAAGLALWLAFHGNTAGALSVIVVGGSASFILWRDGDRSRAAREGAAADTARLFANATARLRDTEAMLEVTQVLNSTLEVRPLLKEVAQKIAQVCDMDGCTVNLLQDGTVIPLMSQFADGHTDPEMWRRYVSMPPFEARDFPAVAVVIETRAPVVVADTRDPERVPRWWVEAFRVRSSVFVPLTRQDSVIGIMNLNYTTRDRAVEPWQVSRASAIAGHLAFAVENARLYGELQERLRETTTLLAVGRALAQPGPMAEVMSTVAREVSEALGADTVGAFQVDARRAELVPLACYRPPAHLRNLMARHPIQLARFAAFGEAVASGRALWSSDPRNDPRFDQEWQARLDPHSLLFAPTTARGRVFGGLFVIWWRPGRAARPAEVRIIEGVASRVGLAMENLDLAGRTEKKLRETEMLLAVSRSLTSTLDLPGLLRQFLRHVQQAIGSDSVGVWLREGDALTIKPIVGYRIPPERLEAVRQVEIPVDHAFYAQAFRTKRPVASHEDWDESYIPEALRAAARHRSKLFVPIVAKDTVIGGFIAVWWHERRDLTDDELQLMESIAGQAGAAIENARLFSDNQRRLEELSLLHDLSRAVTGQLDQATLVQTIFRQLSRVLSATIADILSYDELRQEFEVLLVVKDGVVQRADAGRHFPLGFGLMSRVVERRRPIRTDDYVEACRRAGVTPIDLGLPERYWLGAPMVAGDEVVGVIGLRSSVRPWVEADERLLENIAGLAALAFRSSRLFAERTRAYSELVAAQDHLVRVGKLRALGEMASGVAHGFNNLLMSILGRTQMLLQHVHEARLREWLQVIERAALDGAQTVRRLQEFTRIRRDQAFVPVDLNRVVREALEVTQFRWRDEGTRSGAPLEVVTRFGKIPYVSGDPVELREALTNLILNSVDAMPTGGILSLATALDGDRIEVTVSDNGTGMDDEVKRRLFEPFFTTKGARGTGLGLSMTFGIVSRHGGQIEVDSAPGKGARVHLRFPVIAGVATDTAGAPSDEPAAPSEPAHCLVVDDEEPVRAMLGDLLVMSGHTVVLVESGTEAIQRLKTDAFDVVLTDLGMPKVTGWDVARACKAAQPGLPVILVTGWGVELSREELVANGVDAVLSKPLNVDQILATVAGFRRHEQ